MHTQSAIWLLAGSSCMDFTYNHIKLCLRSVFTTVCIPSTFLVSRTRCVWIHSVETIDASSSSSSSPVRGKIERERIVHNGSDVWTYMYIPSKRLFLALYYITYLTLSLWNRASRVCQPYIFLEKASRQE